MTRGALALFPVPIQCYIFSQRNREEYERNGAPKNLVDRVFGGEMSSTVMCKECKTVSLVTEMFLDLSLPVADEFSDSHLCSGMYWPIGSIADIPNYNQTPFPGDLAMPFPTAAKAERYQSRAQR
ncbi:hypothetical protein QQF64_009049 [Cirrhinus molitorella]|uniref:USP domain-containing protein n=1 Tax=Cirrhinus molitorella TaxID=172907 RepID=A0ABR3MBD0_9TELE